MFHINIHPFYIFLHIFYKTLQDNLIIHFILVCAVMVQVSYIPRSRVMLNLPHYPTPRYVTYTYTIPGDEAVSRNLTSPT